MSHNHSCVCQHSSVKYCAQCQAVYCEGCNREWTLVATTYTRTSYPWYNETVTPIPNYNPLPVTVGSEVSGAGGASTFLGSALTTLTVCNHLH